MDQEKSAPTGQVDVEPMLAAIKMDPKFQKMYDAAVLSGMRIMFDAKSHPMMEKELAKPGPLGPKIVEGIIALIYMLWTQSNKTLPPQIIVPVTVALTLKAFDFVQKSGDPEATKQVLGEAVDGATTGIMQKFGVGQEQMSKLEQIVQQHKGAAPAAAQPAAVPQGGE